MAAARLPMRKLRELLRLKHEAGLSHRAIARACTVGLRTVTAYLQRAETAGLTWPLPADLDDAALEARLFRLPLADDPATRPQPNWAHLHQERKRPGVPLQLLWLEYRARQPTGYAYSQFCARYPAWLRTVTPTMRQVYRAGEKVFVDFAWQAAAPHRSDHRRGPTRCTVCRQPGRERLSLCRSHAGAGSRVLDRRARPHARGVWPPAPSWAGIEPAHLDRDGGVEIREREEHAVPEHHSEVIMAMPKRTVDKRRPSVSN
jgi:hypothetical protein